MITKTVPDTDVLSGLDWDFAPTCDVNEWILGGARCARPAVWLGVAPCGCAAYSCDPHRRDDRPYSCANCGVGNMSRAAYRWVPIRRGKS